MNSIPDIPKEITDAALLVDRWFKEQGCYHWELLGICSRSYAVQLQKAQKKLGLIFEILRRVDDPELWPKYHLICPESPINEGNPPTGYDH